MRLFLAINLPDVVRRSIQDATAPLREAAPDVGWIAAEGLHLTLKFLGEQPAPMAGTIGSAMTLVAARHRALELELGEVGAFPALRRPRVIWLGVDREPRLEMLRHDVESECARLGLEVDGRPFHPHVTLGRVRDRLAGGGVRALTRAARRVDYRETVSVQTVELMNSEVSPGGARYAVVTSSPLRSP